MENNTNVSTPSNDGKEKSPWYLGVFYYNPEDKRLIPGKRVKWLGWTINFANPYSILLGIGILALAIVSSRFIKGWYMHF